MLRVRLHGRGGQGIKTAAQILGSAAFLAGHQAQDFPLYGAERRGAPIVAFTRIDDEPILERGPIAIPDLILIGDETLLADRQAAPACGADQLTTVFINNEEEAAKLKGQLGLPVLPIAFGLTPLVIRHLGNPGILSVALAAAGARLSGLITLECLSEAIGIELAALGLPAEVLGKNRDLAAEVFAALSPAEFKEREETLPERSRLKVLEQAEVALAAPIITATGNMQERKTGNWRIHRPDIDYGDCNHCLICYARCPEGVIAAGSEGEPVIDYDHCKGCMICAQECPRHAIRTLWEKDHEQP
jgi:pyruvate ferredoxin oxidoreductase gamma subunit